MTIEDVAGRRFPAKSIFTSSIKALVDHFKKSFGKQNVSNVTDNDIKWVLTVPAIWSDAAKKFMRLCATDVSNFFSNQIVKQTKLLILQFTPLILHHCLNIMILVNHCNFKTGSFLKNET